MDIDFPLVLTWAVLISGGIWLFEVLVWRRLRAEAVPRSGAQAQSAGSTAGVQEAAGEPILVEYARSFFPVLLLVLVLRSFLAEPYQIPSESMVPTLEVGDFILVNKYAYGLRLPVLGTKIYDIGEPQRGDVMVFIPPGDDRYFIKRVIGIPGDHIRYADKTLSINGERLKYDFIERQFEAHGAGAVEILVYDETIGDVTHKTYRYPIKKERPQEWVVPEGAYFMMGDNRDRSADSREWGVASEQKIVGKAVAIWAHKAPGLNMPTFARNQWLNE